MLELSLKNYILIQRGELAGKFNCVPSQINYVLATRFTPEQGFLVESRRGGGGHIRVTKIDMVNNNCRDLYNLINDLKERSLNKVQIINLISRLYNKKIITRREAKIMKTVIKELDCLSESFPRENLKKQFLLKMLDAVLKDNF